MVRGLHTDISIKEKKKQFCLPKIRTVFDGFPVVMDNSAAGMRGNIREDILSEIIFNYRLEWREIKPLITITNEVILIIEKSIE